MEGYDSMQLQTILEIWSDHRLIETIKRTKEQIEEYKTITSAVTVLYELNKYCPLIMDGDNQQRIIILLCTRDSRYQCHFVMYTRFKISMCKKYIILDIVPYFTMLRDEISAREKEKIRSGTQCNDQSQHEMPDANGEQPDWDLNPTTGRKM
uniref:Uncharacterized protein n=1 Tax=Romanomermis culicivorax TaxID=13658 RepID=A0A915L8B2_ROMCU